METTIGELPSPDADQVIASRTDTASERAWTFAGTRANRTLARQISSDGQRVKIDALAVSAPLSMLANVATAPTTLSDEEVAMYGKSIKFSPCLPRDLLVRTILARYFESTQTPGRFSAARI